MFGTQTYSGSYNFAPTGGEIIMNAFGRIQIRPTEILSSHLQQALMELNLLLVKMSNLQPNLWSVDLQALPLVQGQATYSLPAETVMITNAYVRTGNNQFPDRLLFPISQTEYASLSNKSSQGTPNQFWFDRLISPTITLYLVPDGNGPYTLYYYRVRQVQDALLANGLNVEVPYLWLDALAAGLAYRLARIYTPQLEAIRKADADEAWNVAATQNTENVSLMISPGLGSYYR
jgi:hypothetical protein